MPPGSRDVATAALALAWATRSETGRRANNEDACFASPRIAAVADGVGGAAAGETASRLAIHAIASLDKRLVEEPLETALADAVELGNGTIGFVASCRPELRGMSTTLTAVALSGDGEYVVANVDDSRTYLFRDGALEPLTRDESLVQELLDSGAITEAEARAHPQRSVVLRALDGEDGRRPAITRREARPGDRLLLCSDGLSDALDDAAIAAALGEPSREECAERLVRLALDAGARDNVSVVVADVVPRTDPAGGWRG